MRGAVLTCGGAFGGGWSRFRDHVCMSRVGGLHAGGHVRMRGPHAGGRVCIALRGFMDTRICVHSVRKRLAITDLIYPLLPYVNKCTLQIIIVRIPRSLLRKQIDSFLRIMTSLNREKYYLNPPIV